MGIENLDITAQAFGLLSFMLGKTINAGFKY